MAPENTLCHFELTAQDPKAAQAFYAGLFGWHIEPINAGNDQYLLIRTSNQPGALCGGIVKQTPGQEQPAIVYINVASIDDCVAKVVELGGQIEQPKRPLPQLGWMALIRDTQGNLLGLFQADPQAAA